MSTFGRAQSDVYKGSSPTKFTVSKRSLLSGDCEAPATLQSAAEGGFSELPVVDALNAVRIAEAIIVLVDAQALCPTPTGATWSTACARRSTCRARRSG
jgi:hypothetical protein